MMKKIITLATINSAKTLMLTALVTIVGVFAFINMPIDVLPNINKPTVIIFAEADGFVPEEVEKNVLIPLENALLGTSNVDRVRGTASFALGVINIEFPFDSDIYRNRQLVQERISNVSLPSNVRLSIGPVSSVMGEIMWVGIKGTDNIDTQALRTFSDFTIKPNLLKLKGISDVMVMGGDVVEWQVRLNADALKNYNLSQEVINEILRKNLQNSSGGILEQQNKEYPVRILVAPKNIEELSDIAIKTKNGVVRLGEVASFVKGSSVVRGSASIDGENGVILRVFKQPDAETLDTTKRVDELMVRLQKTSPEDVTIETNLFRQEWFITAGLGNVEKALTEALIIVFVIVFLFLVRWKPTIITLLAIPTSIAVTAIIFYLLGLSVNVMTLGGIAIALGELVDDAIVSVENIIKRMRDKKNKGLEKVKIIINAVQEVRGSIIYATILVVLVFVPVFFLGGVEGKLLNSLGLAYIISLIASLIVSITLTPALASLMLGESEHEHKTPKLILLLENITEKVLSKIIYAWKTIGVIFFLMIISSAVMYMNAGKEGIPPFNEDSLTIGIVLPTGTALNTTNLFIKNIGEKVKSLPYVLNVSNTTGRAAADPHGSGANSGEMQVVFDHGQNKNYQKNVTEIQSILNNFPGANFSIGKPITHRVEELISGVRAPIVIKIYGDDIEKMRAYGNTIISLLQKEEGVSNGQLSRDVKVPEILIYPNTEMLNKQGENFANIGETIESGFIGNKVGEVVSGLQRTSVVTKLDNESRNSFTGLRDTTVGGAGLNLGNISNIEIGEGRNSITHEGGKRVVVVSANYEGRDIVGTVDNVKTKLDNSKQPENISLSYEGVYQSQKENSGKLTLVFMLVIILIGIILYYAFSSWILSLLILLNIPVAFFGGLIFVYIYGGTISLAHLVGFISLAGISSRNGIMLISRVKELLKKNTVCDKTSLIIQATKERVTPVLMTSIVTGLALIPFIIANDAPGVEFLAPLAVVITGGLITSTITSILFIPIILNKLKLK